MVKLLAQVAAGFLALNQLALVSALPMATPVEDVPSLVVRDAAATTSQALVSKRLLAWDYTNTNSPLCAAKLKTIPFGGSNPFVALYNWNTWTPPELTNTSLFEPMVRTKAQLQGSEWTNLLTAISNGAKVVHFFNEPEMNGINAAEAADLWNTVMVPLRNQYNIKLVSPVTASNDEGSAWLDTFMSGISSAPDYLGLHYYGTDIEATKTYLTERHTKHPYPVIVSEIGCLSEDYSQVYQYVVKLTQWMDTTSFISQYAWFGAMPNPPNNFVSKAAMLMDPTGTFKPLLTKLISQLPMQN